MPTPREGTSSNARSSRPHPSHFINLTTQPNYKETAMAETTLPSIKSMINEVDFVGKSLMSINDLTDDQLYGLFGVARALEPYNRSRIQLVPDRLAAVVRFQPRT